MRFLSRLVMVLALLGGLAYGSYALGRYVLSTRLFGSTLQPGEDTEMDAVARSTRAAGAVTRHVDIKGKPRVEVKVLPADQAGPGPEPPSISDLEKAAQKKSYTPSRPSRTRVVTPQSFRAPRIVRDTSGSRYTSDDERRRRTPAPPQTPRRTRRVNSSNTAEHAQQNSVFSPDDSRVTILGRRESSIPSTRPAHQRSSHAARRCAIAHPGSARRLSSPRAQRSSSNWRIVFDTQFAPASHVIDSPVPRPEAAQRRIAHPQPE
jgi:hypothetical protein